MNFALARDTMIDCQIRPNGVSDPSIVKAFRSIPREAFVAPDMASLAYGETPIPLGHGRHLWAPMDTGRLIWAARPAPTDMVLVIGSGTGYEAAIFAKLSEFVIALEEVETFIDKSSDTLVDLGIQNVSVVEGKMAQGCADQSPFDVIYVCGAVETIPHAWTDQLSDGGRLVVISKTQSQPFTAQVYLKSGGIISHRDVFECVVPTFDSFDRKPEFVF